MAGFVLRKSQRLKTFATMRYFGDGVAGEGIIKDLSLSGSYITGNRPVSIGHGARPAYFCAGRGGVVADRARHREMGQEG